MLDIAARNVGSFIHAADAAPYCEALSVRPGAVACPARPAGRALAAAAGRLFGTGRRFQTAGGDTARCGRRAGTEPSGAGSGSARQPQGHVDRSAGRSAGRAGTSPGTTRRRDLAISRLDLRARRLSLSGRRPDEGGCTPRRATATGSRHPRTPAPPSARPVRPAQGRSGDIEWGGRPGQLCRRKPNGANLATLIANLAVDTNPSPSWPGLSRPSTSDRRLRAGGVSEMKGG